MRVVFAGTPEAALPSLRALIDSPHDVVAVLTRPDAPAGRGRKMVPSPVADLALELGIEVLRPHGLRERDGQRDPAVERLQELCPEVIAVVAYGALVPKELLDLPRFGWINLHFSLLPAYRGAAPVQHAIWRGEPITGASVFQIEEGLDTGPVFGSTTTTVRPGETAGELLERLAQDGAPLLTQVVSGLASGMVTGIAQSDEGVSLAPKITVEDARIDWTQPSLAIERHVRACNPAPGAWTMLRGERVKVLSAEVIDEAIADAPGTLEVTKKSVTCATGGGRIRLREVQPQGKKPMDAADWARGARLESGEHVE